MTKRKKPSKDKGSFENYVDHLNFLYGDAKESYNTYKTTPYRKCLTFLGRTAAARFHMTSAFHDRYDVADELFGATVVPFAVALVGTAFTLLAVWEAGHMLAIKAGLARDDDKAHGDNAVMYFVAGLAISGFSFLVFLKSALSLITRTGFTLLDGWKKSDKDRFSTKSFVSDLSETGADLAEMF